MRTKVPHKSKQFFALAIKLAIVIGAAYFIYHKLAYNKELDFDTFVLQLKASKLKNATIILILFSATFCNWFFEILKWKTLVSHVKQISVWESTAQTLGGLTASLFTPNRIGEYGAKALFFKKSERKHVVGLNFLGNFAQLLVTTLFGIIGLALFTVEFRIELPWKSIMKIGGFLLLFMCFVYLVIQQKQFRNKGYGWKNLKCFFQVVSKSIHLKNTLFSTLRYVAFSHQFYFLLFLFNPNISYVLVMSSIAAMYLITSVIPMFFMFDVIVKGSVAVWLFEYVQISDLQILSVVSVMWISNFVLPSIFGSYFVLTFHPSVSEDNAATV